MARPSVESLEKRIAILLCVCAALAVGAAFVPVAETRAIMQDACAFLAYAAAFAIGLNIFGQLGILQAAIKENTAEINALRRQVGGNNRQA